MIVGTFNFSSCSPGEEIGSSSEKLFDNVSTRHQALRIHNSGNISNEVKNSCLSINDMLDNSLIFES